MKKQLAIALTAALLTFPATPGLVMADTTADSGTTAVTATTIQTDSTGSSTSTSAATNTDTSTTVPTATTSSAITAPVVDQNGQTVNSGALPDSPLYWFQTLIEKVQLALAFDPVKKAELTEKQATEDLAEAQALLEKGNTTEAEKALTRYNQRIDSAQAFLDQLKDPNSETAQKVQLALTKVNTNNMVVLGSLLEKLPPQAAQRLALNIVRSVEKAVAKAEKTDKKGQDSTTGTTADSAATQTDSTGTTDQVQLNQEAQKALEKFQAALGVKHTPNGYAYGYYKNKKTQAGATDGEDQDEQAANTNTDTDQAVQQTRTQQQAPAQVQKEVPTQSQPQATQHGNSAEAKKHNDRQQNDNSDNNDNSDKEKGYR